LAEQPEARSLGGQRAMAMRSVAGVIAAIFGVTLLDLVACSRLQGRLVDTLDPHGARPLASDAGGEGPPKFVKPSKVQPPSSAAKPTGAPLQLGAGERRRASPSARFRRLLGAAAFAAPLLSMQQVMSLQSTAFPISRSTRVWAERDLSSALGNIFKAGNTALSLFPRQPKEVNNRVLPQEWRQKLINVRLVHRGSKYKVYKAKLTCSDLVVGVKVVDISSKHPELLGHVDRELCALRLFGGRDVVGLLDATMTQEKDGTKHVFMMVEAVDGNLKDVMNGTEFGKVLPAARLRMAVELLRGLQRVARAGYFHRDVKPESIFVVNDEGVGDLHMKLAGFGHSVSIETLRSGAGANVGSPGTGEVYTAPEVRWGYPYTSKSDSFSLGMVLLELFSAGRWPDADPLTQEQRRQAIADEMARCTPTLFTDFWDVRGDPRFIRLLEEDKEVARLIRRLCARRTWKRWSAAKALEWASKIAADRGVDVPVQLKTKLPAKSLMTPL